jgi:uncharacterized protein (TIGR02271 family)
MKVSNNAPVISADGMSGTILSTDDASAALIHLDNGRQVQVPAELLRAREDGRYFLPVNVSELEQAHDDNNTTTENVLTIPVVAETLHVDRHTVETGRARITKHVHEREEVIDEPLLREEVAVEHVPINRPWEGPPPPVRYEGEKMIIPLMEEVLVVEKRLMLKEELHVWRVQKTVHAPQHVTLRSEEVTVERIDPDAQAAAERA